MGGRPFLSERLTTELQNNFHREIRNGITPQMLNEQRIGSSPNFFSVKAAHIDPCLTDDQKRKASDNQGLSVIGLNKNGKKWNLQLRKENETYIVSEETRNKMTVANGWQQGTTICIWGAPGGKFGDGKVRFLFTNGM